MGEKESKGVKKQICAGLLAHVDAGKTTLSEAILYLSGSIRTLGRVDYKDAFLDTYALERERGITIFSKQAGLQLKEMNMTLLDTPGHVDFSAEMERTLQVLDYAVLVISGADGVQGHTETLWRLLSRYQIPTFLFVNKMDQPGTDKEALLQELKKRLDAGCIDFNLDHQSETFQENVAVCEETLLERYLEEGEISQKDITDLIASRKLFPCYFGSALKLTGVEELLKGMEEYTRQPLPKGEFGAKAYKISRDEQGNRLTHMKITGGTLKVKTALCAEGEWEEKVNQIRIYSGAKYEAVNEAGPGTICAVTGLTQTYPGEGLGVEKASEQPVLEPILTYRIDLPQGCEVHSMLQKLKQLEEEEPQLHILWNEGLEEIQAQLMGEVQIEVFKSLIQERFGVEVSFGTGNIVYKETISAAVEGVGHFEPLRHYAEVHLLLEPGERGSGLVFDTNVSEDVLDKNWQRLILTHLEEKQHIGVLTGSVITDMKITLIAGRAHMKHTEGGDFRQATYRAVRQGLRKAENILLEPYYEYHLEVPSEMVGRAITDVERMGGSFRTPELEGDMSILHGKAPVATMRDYQTEVISYTKGRGRLTCVMKGYEICHNSEEVIEALHYDADADLENPAGSIFCSHGAGFYVDWNQVEEYMHLEGWKTRSGGLESQEQEDEENLVTAATSAAGSGGSSIGGYGSSREEKELEEIFKKTYGVSKRERNVSYGNVEVKRKEYQPQKKEPPVEEYLLVDGYNIIFAWEELKELAEVNIDSARSRLIDILCNYQGYKKCHLILVFDAYKVLGQTGEMLQYHNINVVYTKEAETADQYIEKLAYKIGSKYRVTVATSDGLVQLIIMGQGCVRMSASELKVEVDEVSQFIRKEYLENPQKKRTYLFDHADEETAAYIEQVRLGVKKYEEEKK